MCLGGKGQVFCLFTFLVAVRQVPQRRRSSISQQVSLKLLGLLDEEPNKSEQVRQLDRSDKVTPQALLQSFSNKSMSHMIPPHQTEQKDANSVPTKHTAILRAFSAFMRTASGSDFKTDEEDGNNSATLQRSHQQQSLLDCDTQSLVYALTLKSQDELQECLPALEQIIAKTRQGRDQVGDHKPPSLQVRALLLPHVWWAVLKRRRR